MGQLHYHATRVDQRWLEENRFFFSRIFSDIDDPVYVKRFAVFKWGEITTLEAEVRLHTATKEATIDVYDGSGWTRGIYAPFYYRIDTIHDDFVETITQNIESYCKRLEFIKCDE